MYKIVQSLLDIIKPYRLTILIVILVIVFLYGAYFAYKQYGKAAIENNKFNDVANADQNDKSAEILFFYTTWCPHCTKAKPEWEKFVAAYDNKLFNGYKINCRSIDCDNDASSQPADSQHENNVKELVAKYDVQGYPTIKMDIKGTGSDDVIIEFDSKVSFNGLEKFINGVLEE